MRIAFESTQKGEKETVRRSEEEEEEEEEERTAKQSKDNKIRI